MSLLLGLGEFVGCVHNSHGEQTRKHHLRSARPSCGRSSGPVERHRLCAEMQLKHTVSPSAGRRLVPASALNVRQAACSRVLQRRSPKSQDGRIVPGAVAQQPRIQRTTNRNVVLHVSHNDGLEVRSRYSSNAANRKPLLLLQRSKPWHACADIPHWGGAIQENHGSQPRRDRHQGVQSRN